MQDTFYQPVPKYFLITKKKKEAKTVRHENKYRFIIYIYIKHFTTIFKNYIPKLQYL